MKRLLALLLILTNFLFLVGCATKIKDDFSVVTHIEITKYRTVWEEGDTEKILASVKLDKKEDLPTNPTKTPIPDAKTVKLLPTETKYSPVTHSTRPTQTPVAIRILRDLS